jgi:hypothetical protein
MLSRESHEADLRFSCSILPHYNSRPLNCRFSVIGRHSPPRANIAFVDRNRAWSKAIPLGQMGGVSLFVFWFLLMPAIWFFLLGWAHFIFGSFLLSKPS